MHSVNRCRRRTAPASFAFVFVAAPWYQRVKPVTTVNLFRRKIWRKSNKAFVKNRRSVKNTLVQDPPTIQAASSGKIYEFEEDHLHLQQNKLLGTGAFSRVFKAIVTGGFEELIGQEVVVKTLLKDKESFRQGEVELYVNSKLAQLSPRSRNIAHFLGHHIIDNRFWLVWSLEGERTLDSYFQTDSGLAKLVSRLEGTKTLSVKDLNSNPIKKQIVMAEIASQLFKGLRVMHDQSLVHKDMKPMNVVLGDTDGQLKLIDFGCCAQWNAHELGDGEAPREYPGGTRAYAAPEKTLDVSCPAAFDMFAVGMMMLLVPFRFLRQHSSLDTFRDEFDAVDGNLEAWAAKKAKTVDASKLQEGLKVLLANDGVGLDFLQRLLLPDPTKRMTIEEAQSHQLMQIRDEPPL